MAQELNEPVPAEPQAITVAHVVEVNHARDAASNLAAELGFAPAECHELALVATELASNLVKHASRGKILLSPVQRSSQIGLRIESEDNGPGIPDVEQALTDGYSTAGSLGIGLGIVNRLMDDLEFYSNAQTGLRIVCHRWLRPQTGGLIAKGMAFGVATRSCKLLPENGDAFVVKQWEGHSLAGIIDGLGHGQFAQRASHAARYYVEQHFDQPLDGLFRGVERACRATRGVVMALARFDLAGQKVTIANVGNVEVRLIGSAEKFRPMVRRGIIGLNAPRPAPTEHPWTSTDLLIMHSDGLRSHWSWDEFSSLAREEPGVIASRLLRALGKIEDDATVIVARRAAV